MKAFVKYAPIGCAVLWAACFVLSILFDSTHYRLLFTLASATLVITNLMFCIKEIKDAGKTERTENESGSEPNIDIGDIE